MSTSVRSWVVKALSAAVLAVAALTLFAGASHAATVTCSLYASPSGSDSGDGSLAHPFHTPQALVDALHAGQTGCLRGGTYDNDAGIAFRHGGHAGAPLAISSYPGETATLEGGIVYVQSGSDDVTIENLHINADHTDQVGVQLMAANGSLIGDDITNSGNRTSCVILGSNAGWGQAVGTVIQDSTIHQCGTTADGNQDHAIYFDNSTGAQITNNVIWGTAAYAIHLYQNAQNNQITHNVIDGNGYGVIFAGSGEHTSNGNVVAENIIANSNDGYDVESYWGGSVGQRNLLSHNCLSSGRRGEITTVPTGFARAGNVTADPEFVNAAAHDYRLRPGSPCLSVVGYDTSARLAGGPVATVASTGATHTTRTRVAKTTHRRRATVARTAQRRHRSVGHGRRRGRRAGRRHTR